MAETSESMFNPCLVKNATQQITHLHAHAVHGLQGIGVSEDIQGAMRRTQADQIGSVWVPP
jgi:hypothetical protein